MCLNRTFRGNDLNVIFDPLTALTGVTKRRQILCSCKVISPESFNTTLIDARIACNKTIYCEAPLVSGIPDLNSQCVNKEQDFEYFHHNVDHGSGIGPEFNITFDSLCPPEHLWLALSGWYTSYYILSVFFMPSASEKLRGHIGLGLSVRPSVLNTSAAEKLENRLC